MSILSNGITAEVFRDAMPPYQLSAHLLAAMFTVIPAPWSGSGLRREDGEGLGADVEAPAGGPAGRPMPAAETTLGSSFRGHTQRANGWGLGHETSARGQGLPGMIGDSAKAMEAGPAVTEDSGPDEDAAASGGDRGSTDGLVPLAAARSPLGSTARGQAHGSSAQGQDQSAMTSGRTPASAKERDGPPRPRRGWPRGRAGRSMPCAGARRAKSWRATSRAAPRRLPRRQSGSRDAGAGPGERPARRGAASLGPTPTWRRSAERRHGRAVRAARR
jgi:hypothetical protein